MLVLSVTASSTRQKRAIFFKRFKDITNLYGRTLLFASDRVKRPTTIYAAAFREESASHAATIWSRPSR